MNRRTIRGGVALAAAALVAAVLVGCAPGVPASEPSASSTALSTSAGSQLLVSGAWIKAVEAGADTAVSAELTSRTGRAVPIVGVQSSVAGSAQLHTTAMADDGAMKMQKVSQLKVPASGTLRLEPGGDHIMLFDVARDIEPGESVKLTLRLADGSQAAFSAVVKDYAGAKERYATPSPSGTAPR